MNIVGVIPARMGASRFPGKPLAKIHGIPMVGHVYFRSKMSRALSEVYVAAVDKEIADYVKSVGGKAVIVAGTHRGALDATAEAITHIEKMEKRKVDYAAMIQGDEPMLSPETLDSMIKPLFSQEGRDLKVINLIERIDSEDKFQSPNIVKAVLDQNNHFLYLSREPIPSKKRYHGEIPMRRQMGIILFERDILLAYAETRPTPLEVIESVDMNRFLEKGVKIKAVLSNRITQSVDTKEELTLVEGLLKKDPLLNYYLNKATA